VPDTRQISRGDKLYLVTRKDLSPGYQVAQTAHAVAEFAISHPELFEKWYRTSQYVVALESKTLEHLSELHKKGKELNIPVAGFHEPDLDNQLTAVAFAPSEHTAKLLTQLPLASRTAQHDAPKKSTSQVKPASKNIQTA